MNFITCCFCFSLNNSFIYLSTAGLIKKKKREENDMASSLTDEELRAELVALGVTVGPITPSTRGTYERQLLKRRTKPRRSNVGVKTKLENPSDPSKISKNFISAPPGILNISVRFPFF